MIANSTGQAKNRPIDWVNVLFLSLTPLASLALGSYVIYREGFTLLHIILFFAMYFLTGLSVTAGYHRLFAHKAYRAHPVIEVIFLLFGGATFQNSALKWCADHRRHHRHCDDSENDPYSISEGFFYAHIGWIFRQEDPQYAGKYPKDLLKNPRVVWQHRYYLPLAVTVGFLFPTLIGYFFGSALGGLAFGGLIRIVVVHHATFFINSLCHMMGSQPYTEENSAKDSPLMALFTYGEGYHNFHHFFQYDYRNGIKWYHFDPSKWLIWLLALAGQAKNLKRASSEKVLQAKLDMQHQRLQKKNLSSTYLQKAQALKEKLDTTLKNLQQRKIEKNEQRIRALKKELNAMLYEWSLLTAV